MTFVRPWRRFGAVDVHYPARGGAGAALVVATEPRLATVVEEHVAWLGTVEPYEPAAGLAAKITVSGADVQ